MSVEVVVSWNATAGADWYNLYRGVDGGAVTQYQTEIIPTTFEDAGVSSGHTYVYQVSAVNVVGESPLSDPFTILTTAPSTPTGLNYYGTIGGAVALCTTTVGATTWDFQTSPDNATWTDLALGQTSPTADDVVGHSFVRVRATNPIGSSAYSAGVALSLPFANALSILRAVHGFTPSVWTDQTGNGNSPTQGSSGQQGQLSGTLGTKTVVNVPDVNREMDFPDFLPVTDGYTFIFLLQTTGSDGANNLLGGALATDSVFMQINGPGSMAATVYGTLQDSGVTTFCQGVGANPMANYAILMIAVNYQPGQNGGGNTWCPIIWYLTDGDSQPVINTTILSPEGRHPNQQGLALWSIKGLNGFGYQGNMPEVAIVRSVPSVVEINNYVRMQNATYGTAIPLYPAQMFFLGDSITNGGVATPSGGSWVSLLQFDTANHRKYSINQGWGGAATSNFVANHATTIDPYITSAIPTVCTVFLGTNDFAALGRSVDDVYADLLTICNLLVSLGAEKVIVFTMLPRTGLETKRIDYNNRIRTNFPGLRFLVADVATLPMGAPGANTDLTWYGVDQIHPNDTGHADLHDLVSSLI